MSHLNLKKKVFSGALWNGFQKLISRLGGIVLSLLLARILLPSEFGLIGMLMVFVYISQAFVESGFGMALIQKKHAGPKDFSTVFFFNIVTSVIIYLIIYAIAPLVATLYRQPVLTGFLRVLALVIIIRAFGIVQEAILRRRLLFSKLAAANTGGVLIGGFLGIFLALQGFGAWSLVLQQLTMAVVVVVMLWVSTDWRPHLVFCSRRFKGLFSFGSKLLGVSLIDRIGNSLYVLVIGRYFLPVQVGYYMRSKALYQDASGNATTFLTETLMPLMCQLQGQTEMLKSAYRKSFKAAVFLVFPVMAGMFVLIDPFVRVVLTEKWLAIVPYVKIFCFVGIFYPLHILNLQILLVNKRSDLFFYLDIIKRVPLVLILIVSLRYGIIGVVYGELLLSIVCLFINSFFSKRMIDYGLGRQLLDILPELAISTVMGFCAWWLASFIASPLWQLILVPLGGGIIFLSLAYIFKMEILFELLHVGKSLIKRK